MIHAIKFVIIFLKQLIEFTKTVLGTIERPYETYRSLAIKPRYFQLVFIALLILLYLFLSTLARNGLRSSPLFLTASAVKAGLALSATFVVTVLALYAGGRAVGGRGRLAVFTQLWAFTLLPTLAWFLLTTISYVFFPPPRTARLQGQVLSGLALSFSLGCFFWKGILYYLTLRFGLKLDGRKIIFLSAFILPLGFAYAMVLYRLGIFRVPFI